MRPSALTVIAKIIPERLNDLKNDLELVGEMVFQGDLKTHFATWVIINDADHGYRLVLTCDYDGDLSDYVLQLSRAQPPVQYFFGFCEDYSDKLDLLMYIKSHSYRTNAYFIAAPSETVVDILNNAQMRDATENLLDDLAAGDDAGQSLIALSKLHSQLSWWERLKASLIHAGNATRDAIANVIHLIEKRIVALMVTDVYHGAAADLNQLNPTHTNSKEEFKVQCGMTNLIEVRPDRLILLRPFLWVLNMDGRYAYAPGQLAGIHTIHFARWILIDNGKRMLFQSQFDGAWENYMGDFVDKISWGLDSIWGQTKDYPEAGMKDIDAFKRFIGDREFKPSVLYSAYPTITVLNIYRDLQIKAELQALCRQEVVNSGKDLLETL